MKIHWNLKSDYENEMFYEKCKTSLISQENNFNHSLKKCFISLRFLDDFKSNGQETEENSIFYVLSDGIFLSIMFVLIMFLFPFFVYIYLNLFYGKKPTVENNESLRFAEKEPEEDLQNIHVISIISSDKPIDIGKLSESNVNNEIITIGPVD